MISSWLSSVLGSISTSLIFTIILNPQRWGCTEVHGGKSARFPKHNGTVRTRPGRYWKVGVFSCRAPENYVERARPRGCDGCACHDCGQPGERPCGAKLIRARNGTDHRTGG